MSLADWENAFIIWNWLCAECAHFIIGCLYHVIQVLSALYNVFGIYTLGCTVFTAESEAQSGKYSVQLVKQYC